MKQRIEVTIDVPTGESSEEIKRHFMALLDLLQYPWSNLKVSNDYDDFKKSLLAQWPPLPQTDPSNLPCYIPNNPEKNKYYVAGTKDFADNKQALQNLMAKLSQS